MRIAYVEDNPTNLALVERVAGMNQHKVVSYAEGEIAIHELLHEKFDLILMDIELAGELGGLDVVRRLRQAGLTTPIIAVTAYAMMGDRERCLEAGCNSYLPKPLPIRELIVLLAKYDAELQAQAEISVAAVDTAQSPEAVLPPVALSTDPSAVAMEANGKSVLAPAIVAAPPIVTLTPLPAETKPVPSDNTPITARPGSDIPGRVDENPSGQ